MRRVGQINVGGREKYHANTYVNFHIVLSAVLNPQKASASTPCSRFRSPTERINRRALGRVRED